MTFTTPTASSEPASPAAAAAVSVEEVLAAVEQTRMLLVGLGAVAPEWFDDDGLLAALDAVEGVGRLVDAGLVALAATTEERSSRWLGRDSLAWKRGCTSGTDLIARVTRVSGREVKRRAQLGARLRPTQQLGTIVPALFPTVGAAVATGELGVDAAEVIVTGLGAASPRIAPDDLAAAEQALVASATGQITAETAGMPGAGLAFAADLLRGQVQQWLARLDPDGAAPNDTELEARSTFGFGSLKAGLYPLRGGVTPELRGVMNGIFDTYLSAHAAPAFPSAEEQAALEAGAVIPGADDTDTRNGGEKRADILRDLFSAAARDPHTPTLGGAAPTVVVHVNAADLEAGRGVGWVDGVDAPVNLRTVRQLLCAGGAQTILFGSTGEVVRLGRTARFFNRAQRRAILARDGGCAIPGCTVPPDWLEMHHVIPWWAGGETDIGNGVALCWAHHHSIETSGWLIRMVNGRPQIKAPPWLDLTGSWQAAGQHRADTLRGE